MNSQDEPEESLESMRARAAADLAKWTRIAADPQLSPKAAVVANNNARSARACLILCDKALSLKQSPPDPSPFLRTPQSHRAQAELLRQAGNARLARHHDNLAQIIERRLSERTSQPNEPEQSPPQTRAELLWLFTKNAYLASWPAMKPRASEWFWRKARAARTALKMMDARAGFPVAKSPPLQLPSIPSPPTQAAD